MQPQKRNRIACAARPGGGCVLRAQRGSRCRPTVLRESPGPTTD
jgi:hypothetical protein